MSTPNVYSYDCKQPDPEIWGGGSTTGLFTITSGSEYAEKIFYNYDLKVTPGSSAIGSLTFSGETISSYLIKKYIGDFPTYLFSGKGIYQVFYNFSSSEQNIALIGNANYSFISSEISQEASIDYSGFIIEKVTYDYNNDSTVIFSTVDDGLIASSLTQIDNYGLVTDPLQEHVDCGSTEILSTTTALSGGFTLSNAATYRYISVDPLAITTAVLSTHGDESLTYRPPINERLYQSYFGFIGVTFDNDQITFDSKEEVPDIKLTGSASNQYVIFNTPEQTIDVVSTISSIESRGHSYNDSSIGSFGLDDFSTLIGSPTSTLDYGSVSSPSNQGDEDFGFVFDTNNSILPFGDITLSGSALVRPPDDIRTYNTGASYRVTYNPPENTSSLFTFGEKLESVVYDYNNDSAKFVETESLGLISSGSTEIDDFGLLEGVLTEFINYEEIDIVTTNFPFGTLSVNGSANVEYTNINFYGYVLGAEVKVVYSPDDTTGSLFSFGQNIESMVYDYNNESVIPFTVENSGLITSGVSEFENYGNISEISTGFEEYGAIEIVSQSIPFGNILINGSANTEYTNINFYGYILGAEVKVVYSPDNTTGSLFSFGERVESIVYDYNNDSIVFISDPDYGFITSSPTSSESYELISNVASILDDYETILGPSISTDTYPFGSLYLSGTSEEKNTESYASSVGGTQITLSGASTNLQFVAQPSEDVVLYNISGSAGITPVRYSEVGSGSLFGFGEKLESFTYDYNDLSANVLETQNNGLITDSSTSLDDYGLISNPVSELEVYGEVDLTSTVTPFGTISIIGNADIVYRNANFYDYPVTSIVRVTYSPDNTEGTLFAFGEKLESVTYDYNNESLLTFDIDNFALLTDAITNTDDYGFVNEVYGEQIDNGLDTGLGESQTITPFGGLTISGTSGNVLRTYDEENAVLFTISGSLSYPNIDYTPSITGIGTVFVSGSASYAFINVDPVTQVPTIIVNESLIESRTHSYNESSIVIDVTPSYGLISDPTTETGDDYGSVVGSSGETIELGFISVGVQSAYPFGTITIFGGLIHPEIDYTPKYVGTGVLNINGSATYNETDAFGVGRRRGGTINLCGDALYSETDAYIGLGTIFVSGDVSNVQEIDSYVGSGIISLSGTALESDLEEFVGSGIISISGTITERNTESYVGSGTTGIKLFGELLHPNIDYTPHYGIEKNIGIGTTGIQISGVVGESDAESYVGLGSVLVVNGLSPQDTEAYPGGPAVGKSWSFTRASYIAQGSLTISSGIAQTHYYSPIYPRNALIGDPGSGTGTIRINDDNQITFYRATLPIFAKGSIYILGIGTAANGNLNGVEIGANESFTPATEIGSGLFTFSGIASAREIASYQDYVTGGVITISEQTVGIIEKNTEAYFGSGTIFVSESLIERNTESYFGSGTLFTLSGGSEAYSAQTPEETITLTISGSAQESFVSQIPENTILYQFVGAATDEKLIKAYVGSGSATISGSTTVRFTPSHLATGTIRFVPTFRVDDDYISCDSDVENILPLVNQPVLNDTSITFDNSNVTFDNQIFRSSASVTCDRQDNGIVKFVANPPEDTILFNIDGNAVTSETALYTKTSVGLFTLSGTYQSLKLVYSESGIGTVFITSISSESERDVYVGSGNLFTLSGRSESYSAQTPESTIILKISGSALTSIESEYSVVGIGLFVFNGSGITSKITSYTQIASGNITISGQLVHPNIIFIPSPDGSGTINILGSSNNSLTKVYEDTTVTLFTFSSGFESLTKSTYIGVGTIYTQQILASTINNPYQIPRAYVCII